MGYDLTFLGSSGGPIEGSTCSILLKRSEKSYEEMISSNASDGVLLIDAGSGLTALSEIIHNEVTPSQVQNKLLGLYNDSLPILDYFSATVQRPFANLNSSVSPIEHARNVLELSNSYLITHPHMDHICALILNSAGFKSQKSIYGSKFTIEALHKCIFNNVIWPDMVYHKILNLEQKEFNKIFNVNNFMVKMFEVSHGNTGNADGSRYPSSAFQINFKPSNESILVFGDFESDLVSKNCMNKNIWKQIAPVIVDDNSTLNAIVLECSTSSTHPPELYGHMSPEHVMYELHALTEECLKLDDSKKMPLEGLHIIICHVKELTCDGLEPRSKVLQDLNKMNDSLHLGVKFSIALSGATLRI